MASFRATLEFAGKEYDVLHSEYEFSRTTDAKGKPSSNIQGGRVSVVIESTDEIEEDAKMKEIEFKNAYIVHYKETLDVNNDVPMTIALTFSAEMINVGNAALDNRWPKN